MANLIEIRINIRKVVAPPEWYFSIVQRPNVTKITIPT